jgi:RimJ/RimL family protein N-acetyltransferase
MIPVPILTTTRLTLRGFEASDLEALVAMLADPEVGRWLGDGLPIDRTESWRRLAGILGHWALRGFGLWALEERATRVLVGWSGLLQPEGWPGFELAYSLSRPFWGRGYAREGAAEALRYARVELKRPAVISIIRPANLASVRVATALGARRAESIDFLGAAADIYRYPPTDPACLPTVPR